MSAPAAFDHVILGGGLAGLSLAQAMVRHGIRGSGVALVEPLQRALEQRTFCCFVEAGGREAQADLVPARCVTARWPRWSIRGPGPGDAVTHDGGGRYEYVHVDPRALEEALLSELRAAKVTVYRGESVAADAVEPDGDRVRVTTDAGRRLTARRVFDGRPASATGETTRAPVLLQSFVGHEVRTDAPRFDPEVAVLMDFARAGGRTEFLYLLPFSSTHALVEWTRFAPPPADRTACLRELETALGAWVHESLPGPLEVVRRETGHLPMDASLGSGRSHRANLATPIGTAAGWLRPATGYGFLSTRRLADRYGRALAGNPAASPPRPFPAWLRWLDGVFLHRLATEPSSGPRMFEQIARRLPAASFARFLADRPDALDILRLLTSIAPGPMLRAAAGHTIGAKP